MKKADEVNRAYFRRAYTTGVHGWGVLEPSGYAVALLEHVREHVAGGALLDLGCGEGRHAFAAARLGFRVTAVDLEPRALKRARDFGRETNAPHVEFRRADARKLPFGAGSFDIVLDYGCLHHQPKSAWPDYKKSLLHVLKPGGYYILSTFSPRFRMFKGAKRRWHIAYGSYRRCFTRDEIARLFAPEFEMLVATEQTGKDGGFHHCLLRRLEWAGKC